MRFGLPSLLLAVWLFPVPAQADDDEPGGEPPAPPAATTDEGAGDDDNPWLAGPDAEPGEEITAPPYPPREEGAPPDDLQVPPAMPDAARPEIPMGMDPGAPEVRFSTSLDQAQLYRWGDLNLADALVLVPGVWWPYDHALSPLPQARGLPSEHLAVRVDGVPVLPAQAFPGFPALAHVPLGEVTQVTMRHGPRLGLGMDAAAGGVLDVQTLPPAQDLGEEGLFTGFVRGGYGGPNQEKAVFAHGDTGLGRARVSVGAGGIHVDDVRQGRGLPLLDNSHGLGGYLTARADVLPRPGVRVFVTGHASRQARSPLPGQCIEDSLGRYADCVVLQDRARDTLTAGLDTTWRRWGLTVATTSRAHVQRYAEEWSREGNTRVELESTVTQLWRGGALSRLEVAAPKFTLLDTFEARGHVGLELMRDTLVSDHLSRSQRFSDGDPRDELTADDDRAPLAPGNRTVGRLVGGAGLYGEHVTLTGQVQVEGQLLLIQRPDLVRMENRTPTESTASVGGEVAFGVELWRGWRVFGAAVRTERPDSLFELGQGPQRFVPAGLPALPGRGHFVEHALELGGHLDVGWLELTGTGWVAERSGAFTLGVDPDEGRPDVDRVHRQGRRQAGGVEGRARWQTPFDGVYAEGTLGAVAIDEGVFFDPDLPLVGTQPAAGVPRPTGAAAVHWAPTTWPLHVYGRLRYALPQARLSPGEQLDDGLCPQSLVEPQFEPCQGIFGYALYDVGMAFSPTPMVRFEGMATNLLDAPWGLRISSFPGGGVGARAAATFRF